MAPPSITYNLNGLSLNQARPDSQSNLIPCIDDLTQAGVYTIEDSTDLYYNEVNFVLFNLSEKVNNLLNSDSRVRLNVIPNFIYNYGQGYAYLDDNTTYLFTDANLDKNDFFDISTVLPFNLLNNDIDSSDDKIFNFFNLLTLSTGNMVDPLTTDNLDPKILNSVVNLNDLSPDIFCRFVKTQIAADLYSYYVMLISRSSYTYDEMDELYEITMNRTNCLGYNCICFEKESNQLKKNGEIDLTDTLISIIPVTEMFNLNTIQYSPKIFTIVQDENKLKFFKVWKSDFTL